MKRFFVVLLLVFVVGSFYVVFVSLVNVFLLLVDIKVWLKSMKFGEYFWYLEVFL